MNKIYLLILLGFISCSASKEILKEEIKIEQKEIEVEGKEYALADVDFNYEDDEIIVIDTVISVVKDSLTTDNQVKVKVKIKKVAKKADIEVVTPTIYVHSADTSKTVIVKEEPESMFKFWGYWILVFLFLVAIVLFLFKIRI